jgi:hypothetical protein
MMVSDPTEIRFEHFPNTNLKLCSQAILLGAIALARIVYTTLHYKKVKPSQYKALEAYRVVRC